MFALDLFDTKYERELKEGAVDNLHARRIDDLNMKMQELLEHAKHASPKMRAGLMREFQEVERMLKENTQQSRRPGVEEGGMPKSVIRNKEKLRNMSDAEKKEYFKGKSVPELKAMARRHGYGPDSNVYSKHVTSDVEEGETTRTKTGSVHRSTGAYGGSPRSRDPLGDKLDKAGTNKMDRELGVQWKKPGWQGTVDPEAVEEGLKQTVRRFLRRGDPTIIPGILAKSQQKTNNALQTIQDLKAVGWTSGDAAIPGMKPDKDFRDAARYAKLYAKLKGQQGVAEGDEDAVNINQLADQMKFLPTRKKILKYNFIPPGTPMTPMSYRLSDQDGELIKTITSTDTADNPETKNVALKGDVVMSGPSGENYVVKGAKFGKLYDGNVGGIVYPEQGPRMVAAYTGQQVVNFTAPWGESMIMKPGDYLVKGDDGYYRVAKAEYKQTYNEPGQQGVAEGLKQTLRRFDPTIKARIRGKSQDQTNQGLDTIQHLADLDLTSDDMVSRAMKPNTYFKNAARYAKLAKEGMAEGMFTKGPAIDPVIGKQINNIINRLWIHAKQTKDDYLRGAAQELFDILKNTGGTYSVPGSPGIRDVAESPIEMDPADPMNPMIHNHQDANPAKLQYRMARAAAQFKELAKRAENGSATGWESIARQFDELAMNVEQIKHGLDELAAMRKKGGRGSRGIDPNLGEAEGSSTASEAVERAILNRIMVAHTDLLMKFGPEKVMQAAEEVAYNVGDRDEIGTSDVSAYVNQVKQILGAVA